jgi:hypothetical protein
MLAPNSSQDVLPEAGLKARLPMCPLFNPTFFPPGERQYKKYSHRVMTPGSSMRRS